MKYTLSNDPERLMMEVRHFVHMYDLTVTQALMLQNNLILSVKKGAGKNPKESGKISFYHPSHDNE